MSYSEASRIKLSRNVVKVPVDPSIALAASIRRQRIKQGMTQKQVTQKLGMKQLYSYQRLERRCNPSFDLIIKILLIFPALSLDKILR